MKKITLNFQKLFENKKFVMILSVVIAVIAWFTVTITQKPDSNRTIVNVPVSISYEGSTAQSLGLECIGNPEITVTVYVTGRSSTVQKLTADDFIATVSLNNVNQAKEYTLPIEVTKKTNSADYQINSWSSNEVKLSFDRMVSMTFPVEVMTPKLSAADGYIMETAYADVERVSVQGPQAVVEKISRCIVTLDEEAELTDTLSASGTLTFLDETGAAVTSDYMTADYETVQVTVPVYRTRQLDVRLEFINVPKGFPMEKLNYTLSQKTVLVAAAADIIGNQDEVVIGPVDFRNIEIGSEFDLDITLPAGFKNVENVGVIRVTFPTFGLSSKTFWVPASNFVLENVPAGYTAEVAAASIDAVKIVGDSTVISTLTADDLVASIDLSQVTAKKGQYTVTVKVYSQNKVLAWAVGEYSTVITLKEKTE